VSTICAGPIIHAEKTSASTRPVLFVRAVDLKLISFYPSSVFPWSHAIAAARPSRRRRRLLRLSLIRLSCVLPQLNFIWPHNRTRLFQIQVFSTPSCNQFSGISVVFTLDLKLLRPVTRRRLHLTMRRTIGRT